MHALLIRLLETAGVTCDATNGRLTVSERYEDALMSLFDAVRDIRFESWHSFRPLDPAKVDEYRSYMARNEISYEEEIQNDVTWFLVPHGCNQYEWGIEEFGHS